MIVWGLTERMLRRSFYIRRKKEDEGEIEVWFDVDDGDGVFRFGS